MSNQNDDKEWRERVNERMAALTAGQSIQDNRLDDVEEEYVKIGDMQEELREIERKISELRAVMLPDSLGHGGVIRRLMKIEEERDGHRVDLEARLKFWSPIIIACISSAALIFKEWPDISQRWNHNMEELNAPREPGVKVKHKHKHVEVPEEPQEGSD